MKPRILFRTLLLALLLLLSLGNATLTQGGYEIAWHAFSAGGGYAQSGTYSMGSSIGHPLTQPAGGGDYEASSGFPGQIGPRHYQYLPVISAHFEPNGNGSCPLPYGGHNYVRVYSSQYWDWYATPDRWNANCASYLAQLAFPDQVYGQLKGFLAIDPINWTSDKRFYLLIDERTGGGFATNYISEIGKGPGIGIAWDAWTDPPYVGHTYWSHELIAHETVNVFTLLVAFGWPTDWWADHISPFPFMVKIKTLEALGYTDGANADRDQADALANMFLDLQSSYGWSIYRHMLRAVIDDGWVSWNSLSESGGTNPSVLRSSYVAAYLSIGASTNLTSVLNSAFSAQNLGYTLDPQVVQQIIDRRHALQPLARDSTEWRDFRAGRYGR